MTETKFNITPWKLGMKVKFKVLKKEVLAINFIKKEILLEMRHTGETWFSYEDVELVNDKSNTQLK